MTDISHNRTYLPGIDGLRALSVLVVVAFHTGLIDGGWIGVDVFFGISGFLITGLLVAERRRDGEISLRAFWGRRARRLLPALAVLLAFVAALVAFDQVDVATRDVWGAITYSTNWVHIFGGSSYWDHFATPDPLRHLWSLAIEEQFYVVWPVVAVLILRRRNARVLGRVALAGALISAALQVLLIHGGASVDRVYQGTDTRAVAFLIGAAVATSGWPPRLTSGVSKIASLLAVAVLVPAAVWLPGDQRWVFSGALILVSIAGVAALTLSASSRIKWLEWKPLRAVGRWSYGIYLFHWPLAISSGLIDRPSLLRFAIVTSASVALAAFSYRFVESPVRQRRVPRVVVPLASLAAIVAIVLSLVVSGSTSPELDTTVTLAPSSSVPSGSVSRLRVMVFGDSVPAMAADELAVAAAERNIDVEVRADPGCVPSENKVDQYGKPSCVSFLLDTPARVRELGIDVAVIWWAGTGIGFQQDGVQLHFCAPEAQSIERERLLREIGYFADAQRVVLVAPVPRTDLGQPEAEGTECEIESYHRVAHELGLPVIDLRDLVCPSFPDDCDRVHRYDGLHYNGDQALTVARHILDSVLTTRD